MRIVGLTGGISSGKSAVSNLFKTHSIPVVDADLVAQDAVKQGTAGWEKVVKAFGDDILQPDGEVDRLKLGRKVVPDPEKRELLFRLLAPYITSGMLKEIGKQWLKGNKVIVVDIPLLFEVKIDKWTKPNIVVWVDSETQLKRFVARDGITEYEANFTINAEMPLDSKRSRADIVIDNTGSLEDLNKQFQNVLRVVARPLTWSEFMLSRQGAFSAIAFVALGVLMAKRVSK